jgi:hypothetical protein
MAASTDQCSECGKSNPTKRCATCNAAQICDNCWELHAQSCNVSPAYVVPGPKEVPIVPGSPGWKPSR